MIVRINQIDVARAEPDARWASEGMLGPVWFTWPIDTRAYEVLILDHDEQKQPLPEEFRQSQTRLVIPQAIAALREPGEEIVIRLDGPVADAEILAAFRHLTETDLTGRFAISDVRKLDPAPQEVIGSVRLQPSPQTCSDLCMDPDLGLERSVRLRAFAVPEELVNPLLDISDPHDERWREILPHAGFVLGTARGLRAVQVLSRRLGPQDVKSRLMQRLMAVARPREDVTAQQPTQPEAPAKAQLRILYAAGPGDVIGTYRHWKEWRDDPSQVAVTYSGQFYDLCRKLGAHAYVIAYCPRRERVVEYPFIVEHRPLRFQKGPSPLYHLEQVWYGVRLALAARQYHPDVAVVSGGAHWFSLIPLRWVGVRVVPTLHCVLWRKDKPPSGPVARLIWWLNRRFFSKHVAGVLSLSKDITDQLAQLRGRKRSAPGPVDDVVPFLPTYRPASFNNIAPPDPAHRPFRVLFAGRIERNKGVFDLLAVAERFAREGHHDVEFDLCGDGAALADLRARAAAAGLADRFRCHGHRDRTAMRAMYAASHAVIAPTTSDFIEGFNKVVAEGVLAGRPVITSSVCPALEYVRDAVVEVPPNDATAYGDAILRLRDDPPLYESKRAACARVAEPFYDPDRGWAAALHTALKRLGVTP